MDEYKIGKIFGTITAISGLVIVVVGLDANTWKIVCNGVIWTIAGVVGVLGSMLWELKKQIKELENGKVRK